MNWDWSPLSTAEMQYYGSLCPAFEYRVLPITMDLPGISKGLLHKCSSLMLTASADGSGRLFYMTNLLRPDPKDRRGHAIDQMPFGFVFDSGSPFMSGALIQHGNWPGRTTYPPVSAWQNIINRDYATLTGLSLIPPASAGPIADLEGSSHLAAFDTMIDKLCEAAKEAAEPATERDF